VLQRMWFRFADWTGDTRISLSVKKERENQRICENLTFSAPLNEKVHSRTLWTSDQGAWTASSTWIYTSGVHSKVCIRRVQMYLYCTCMFILTHTYKLCILKWICVKVPAQCPPTWNQCFHRGPICRIVGRILTFHTGNLPPLLTEQLV
jgi:hypothetical protein